MALTVAEVETSIQTILTTGQSVTIDGMTYNAANLKSLMELRDQLQGAINRANGRPVFSAFKMSNMGY